MTQYVGNWVQTKANSGIVSNHRSMSPMSLSQEELWRRETMVPGIPPLYNECISVRMHGPVEMAALEWALTEIVRRHEVWRSTFETRDGCPVQVTQPTEPIQLPVLDLRDFPEAQREKEAFRLMGTKARMPFVLEREPPIRPAVVRMADEEYRLFVMAHQMVLDGVSAYQLFPFELAAFYKAFVARKSSALPPLPIQYGDFACWQRTCITRQLRAQIEYWEKQLGPDIQPLKWSKRKVRPQKRCYRGVIRPFSFTEEVSEQIRAFTYKNKTTLFSTLVAGFAALLHSYTHQTDIIVGTLSPCGRKRSEVLPLLGYFLNPVSLRFDFRSDLAFELLTAQARRLMTEAICNDDVPIEHIARHLKSGDASPSPFFSAALSLQPKTPQLGLNWTVTSMDVENGGSPWELYLAFIEKPSGLIGRAQFDPDIFDIDTVNQMLQDLERLLEGAVACPHKRVSKPLFAPEQQ